MFDTARVAVVGSANMDFIFQSPRLPAPGETVLGGRFQNSPGGKGANQAVAIGKLGGSVDFVGRIGSDASGEAVLASLNAAGVRTTFVSRSLVSASGAAAVIVDPRGENSIIVAPGSNAELTPEHVVSALAGCSPKVVLAQLEVPLGAVLAGSRNHYFVLNPAPAMALPDQLLRYVKVLTPNETESEILTGIRPDSDDSCRATAAALHARGVGSVILTLGSRGCFVSDGRQSRHIEPRAVSVVDTTAAGDAFSGALAYFLALERDIWNAAELGGCVAALSTTKRGAQASMPTFAELKSFAGSLL